MSVLQVGGYLICFWYKPNPETFVPTHSVKPGGYYSIADLFFLLNGDGLIFDNWLKESNLKTSRSTVTLYCVRKVFRNNQLAPGATLVSISPIR